MNGHRCARHRWVGAALLLAWAAGVVAFLWYVSLPPEAAP